MPNKPTVPPVYSPFAPRVVMQTPAPGRGPAAPALRSRPAAAPPVFRPASSIQPKPGGPVPPPVYRPARPLAAGVVQRIKVKKPAKVTLTGGNGVSVLWKKSKKNDVPHVSVGHGPLDQKSGELNVTNFHYKFAHAGYYHWDDKGSTTFKFRGGEPTIGVYDATARQARKFGITLERPSSCPEPVAAPKPVVKAVVASTPVVEEEDNWGSPPPATVVAAQQDVPDSWDS